MKSKSEKDSAQYQGFSIEDYSEFNLEQELSGKEIEALISTLQQEIIIEKDVLARLEMQLHIISFRS